MIRTIKLITALSVVALLFPRSAQASLTTTEFAPSAVLGFEVIMAGPCDSGAECAMGHALLRIVRREGLTGLDPVLSFTTTDQMPESFAGQLGFSIRALTGLRLVPGKATLDQVYRLYVGTENRTMTRIALQTSPEVKAQLLRNIAVLFSPDSEISRHEKNTAYNYLFANCVGLLVKLLGDAGLPHEMFGIAIPANLPAYLFRTYNALYPEISILKTKSFEGNFDALPAAMYTLCDDAVCAKQVRATFANTWPGQEIEFPRFEKPDRDFERETLRTRSQPNHWNGAKPLIIKHFELLNSVGN